MLKNVIMFWIEIPDHADLECYPLLHNGEVEPHKAILGRNLVWLNNTTELVFMKLTMKYDITTKYSTDRLHISNN